MSFFAELKRRNVYRVAALYVIAGWLILQVTDVTASLLVLPDWAGKLVFLLLALGFPVALILAWAFELTPEGLQRDQNSGPDSDRSAPRRSRLDYLIVGGLLVAVAYFAWRSGQYENAEGVVPGQIGSLVVLPLENLTNDPGEAYFVSGMHEALITELSRIEALRVISKTSALRYRDSGKSVPEIARELGVDAIVEGSVLRAGDVVRITVQLIEAQSDRHLWARNFDREVSDILSLYGEVTGEIARQIQVELGPDERASLSHNRKVDPEVYDLLLKGRYLCDNWSPDEMAQGIGLLEAAVTRDPLHAEAHAQLAICLQYSAFFGYSTTSAVLETSRASAEAAVALDGGLAEAHVALAGVRYYLEFKSLDALASLENALRISPRNDRALLHISWLLGESGRFDEALSYTQQALYEDPLSILLINAKGQIHYLAREYDEAIASYNEALALDRSDPSLHYTLGWVHEATGNIERAIALHTRAVEMSGGASLYRGALGYVYGLAGREEEAQAVLGDLLSDPSASAFDIGLVQLGLGALEPALDQLERAFENRHSHMVYINCSPRFDPLRSHPRFIQLLRRMNFLESSPPCHSLNP